MPPGRDLCVLVPARFSPAPNYREMNKENLLMYSCLPGKTTGCWDLWYLKRLLCVGLRRLLCQQTDGLSGRLSFGGPSELSVWDCAMNTKYPVTIMHKAPVWCSYHTHNTGPTTTLLFASAPFLIKILASGINGYLVVWFHVKLCAQCTLHCRYRLFLC
jgi:hypothetical protein